MYRPASADRESHILELWERAVGLDRWRRDDALLAASRAVPKALGARNAALLDLRNSLFARSWPFRSQCPDCGLACAFDIDSVALADDIGRQPLSAPASFEWAGRRVMARPPTSDDLQAVSCCADARAAIAALLARCIEGDAGLAEAGDADLDAIGRHLEQLDPGAAIGFALICPGCGAAWSAALDVGDALWAELKRAAEQSLVEVDTLARVYGWTEAGILQLSPTRRAAYLQLAEGA